MPCCDQLAEPDTAASSAEADHYRLVLAGKYWVFADKKRDPGGVEELPTFLYGYHLPEVVV